MAALVTRTTVTGATVDQFNDEIEKALMFGLGKRWKLLCVVPQHVEVATPRGRWQATIFWEVEE